MVEENDFNVAIMADPRDDTVRLVYADWLEERGRPGDAERAEFIRLSISRPETTYWLSDLLSEFDLPAHRQRAQELWRPHGNTWTETLYQRVDGSPLRRWLDSRNCDCGYRRGFVAVFEGTQQVVLDAWDDLFRLGPIEEVRVFNLCHLGAIVWLRQFLDRPCLRILDLSVVELRPDDVTQLKKAADWLKRLDRVEFLVNGPNAEASRLLTEWLASDASLRHITWQ